MTAERSVDGFPIITLGVLNDPIMTVGELTMTSRRKTGVGGGGVVSCM